VDCKNLIVGEMNQGILREDAISALGKKFDSCKLEAYYQGSSENSSRQ